MGKANMAGAAPTMQTLVSFCCYPSQCDANEHACMAALQTAVVRDIAWMSSSNGGCANLSGLLSQTDICNQKSKEKSTSFGVGYGCPWIAQWRPGF